jgi:hypothetical protein
MTILSSQSIGEGWLPPAILPIWELSKTHYGDDWRNLGEETYVMAGIEGPLSLFPHNTRVGS